VIERVDNLGRRSLARRARGASVVLLLVLGLGGGVGVPYHRYHRAETRHERAVQSTGRLTELRSEIAAFEAAGGFDRLEQVRRAAAEQVPAELSVTGARGATLLLCGASGLELSTLAIGELADPGIEGGGLGVREVDLTGVGTPEALRRLTRGWRELGYPADLLECRLSRESGERGVFEITATLGLYQSAPWLAATTAEPEGGSELPGEEAPR